MPEIQEYANAHAIPSKYNDSSMENYIHILADRRNATFGCCHNVSSVVCLSVTATVSITQFSLKCSQMP